MQNSYLVTQDQRWCIVVAADPDTAEAIAFDQTVMPLEGLKAYDLSEPETLKKLAGLEDFLFSGLHKSPRTGHVVTVKFLVDEPDVATAWETVQAHLHGIDVLDFKIMDVKGYGLVGSDYKKGKAFE